MDLMVYMTQCAYITQGLDFPCRPHGIQDTVRLYNPGVGFSMQTSWYTGHSALI